MDPVSHPKRKRERRPLHLARLLLVLGAAVPILAVLGLCLFFRVDSLRPRIETAASGATGLDVRIAGKIALSFHPFGLSLKDIRVSRKGVAIGSLENVQLGIDLLPLLRRELKITSCAVAKPAFTIVREANGHFNFESTEKRPAEGAPPTPLTLSHLEVSEATLTYLDEKSKERTELMDVDLTAHDLLLPSTSLEELFRKASLEGSIRSTEVRRGDLRIENAKSSVKMENGTIHLTHLTMDLFGSKAEGDATADLSGVDSVFAIDVKAKNLEFAKLEESIGARRVIVGRGDLKASLKTKVRKGSPPLSGLAGTVSLRGDKLTITTLDLDKALSSYEASQQFSLVDLGAFFLISPLSVVALKGYDYGKAFSRAKGGQGQITHFISHWKIEGGLAEAIDCALATPHHRIALKGSLDLVTGRFDAGAMVAILDDQACAKRSQSIAGPLGSPKVGATNLATSFGGPIIDLFSKAKRFLKGGKCEVFYRGAVQQPSG